MLATLLDLGIPHEDIPDVLTTVIPPSFRDQFDSHVAQLTTTVGEVREIEIPKFEQPEGAPAFYFVQVFLAALPHVKRYHRSLGIPDEVSRLTLTDVGRHLAVNRRRFGIPGLGTPHWLTRHLRGVIYQLGRLQFERVTIHDAMGADMRAAGLPYGPGDPALFVHIPEFCGPFSPDAVDASLAAAPSFFARHFPEVRYEVAICHSWLLDRQLAEYLPPTSNIVSFQRRFTPSLDVQGETILRFVAEGTRLHDIALAHKASGRSWWTGAGWIQLSPSLHRP